MGAYSDKAPLVAMYYVPQDGEFVLTSTSGRRLLLHTGAIAPKSTRSTIGVAVMSLKKNKIVDKAVLLEESGIQNVSRYRVKSLPAAGALLKEEDAEEKQMGFF